MGLSNLFNCWMGQRKNSLIGKQVPGINYAVYIIEAELGQGSFSDVYRADDYLKKKPPCAVKVAKRTDENLLCLKNEASILKELHHDNIVNLITCKMTPIKVFPAFIMLEFMNRGSLEKFYKKLTEKLFKEIIVHIAEALKYLHEKKIAHCDIKPANILLTEGNDNQITAKLGDFGLARHYGDSLLGGTLGYIPPEYILKTNNEIIRLNRMKSVNSRFDPYSLATTYKKITNSAPELNNQLPKIINASLNNAPDKRPEAPKILSELKNDIHKRCVIS